jgi:hypothetical protein
VDQIPPYSDATILTVPDTFKSQFAAQVASTLKNPQVAAQATTDSADKVKAFYTDYLTKNGWQDASALLGGAASQYKAIEQAGGFFLVYSKGTQVFMVLGLPSSTASAIGFTETIPAGSTLVLGFTGETTLGGTAATGSTVAATTAASATTVASSSGDDSIPLYTGATPVQVPDTIKNQFSTSVASSLKNPDVAAFTTTDAGAKVKTFYQDTLKASGWNDLSASLPSSATAQFDQLGGFLMVFQKDKKTTIILALPGQAAIGLGVPAAEVPSGGTLVLGFSGEA